MKTTVKKTSQKGRGIFAEVDFKKGDIIEVCQLILMDLKDVHGALEAYVYHYSGDTAAIALGNGSLYNHAEDPNCEFYFNYTKKVLILRAIKSIKKGQEITLNYGYTEEEKKNFGIHY